VAAESAFGVEQEFIHGVIGELGWIERVVKWLLPEHGEHGVDQFHIVGVRAAQLARQLLRARIAIPRQSQIARPRSWPQRLRILNVGIGSADHIDGPRQRLGLHQGVVIGQLGARLIPAGRPIEHEKPAMLMRLHHYRVVILDSLRLLRRCVAEAGSRSRPRVAIEVIQHGTAPIAFGRRRGSRIKPHAEGDLIRQSQLSDVAGTHGVAQTRGGGFRVIGDLPQRRCEAREQQPENQCQRQRLCQDAAAIA
jgi:hypothetical protein